MSIKLHCIEVCTGCAEAERPFIITNWFGFQKEISEEKMLNLKGWAWLITCRGSKDTGASGQRVSDSSRFPQAEQ